MNEKNIEGTVVIISTGQAGTIVQDNGSLGYQVLLANGEMWNGFNTQCREPQDAEDLAACPLEVDRFEGREKPLPVRPKQPSSRRDDF